MSLQITSKTLYYNVVNRYYNMVYIIQSTLSVLTLNKTRFISPPVKTPAAMFPFELRPLSVRKSAALWVMVCLRPIKPQHCTPHKLQIPQWPIFETNKNFIEGTGVNLTTMNNLNNWNKERFIKLVTETKRQVKTKYKTITTYS